MTIVFLIHGINNQNNSKENIEKTWIDALKSGADSAGLTIPDGVQFKAAFYGDILYKETESWNENKNASIPKSVASPDEDYSHKEIAALYREFQEKYKISDKEVKKELDNKDVSDPDEKGAGIHKKWLIAIARALEKVLPEESEKKIVKTFLTQAAAYLHKPGLKEKIDNLVVTQTIDRLPADEEVVIISHSLGTIIAYDLLRQFRDKVKVKLLLTAGSPLGIDVVKRRLGDPLICLDNIERWLNIADEEDFVAFQTKLNDTTFGCDKIDNIDNLDNGYEDPHSMLKYLSHNAVAEEILSNL